MPKNKIKWIANAYIDFAHGPKQATSNLKNELNSSSDATSVDSTSVSLAESKNPKESFNNSQDTSISLDKPNISTIAISDTSSSDINTEDSLNKTNETKVEGSSTQDKLETEKIGTNEQNNEDSSEVNVIKDAKSSKSSEDAEQKLKQDANSQVNFVELISLIQNKWHDVNNTHEVVKAVKADVYVLYDKSIPYLPAMVSFLLKKGIKVTDFMLDLGYSKNSIVLLSEQAYRDNFDYVRFFDCHIMGHDKKALWIKLEQSLKQKGLIS